MLDSYAYLCDLEQCTDCSFPECRHTTDIHHRLYKETEVYEVTEMKLIGSGNGVNYYMEVFKERNI